MYHNHPYHRATRLLRSVLTPRRARHSRPVRLPTFEQFFADWQV